jgi:hypothetical protein
MHAVVHLVVVVVAATLGCEGGRGGFRYVSEMTDAELTELCNEARDVFPQREISCEGMMLTIGISPETCAMPDEFLERTACTATAGEVLECFDAFEGQTDAQLCELIRGEAPATCSDPVIACFGN